MHTEDLVLAAELLAAVQYRQELEQRHRAEVVAARDRLVKAAIAVGGMSAHTARLQIIMSVYEHAVGAKRILAGIAGLAANGSFDRWRDDARARSASRAAEGRKPGRRRPRDGWRRQGTARSVPRSASGGGTATDDRQARSSLQRSGPAELVACCDQGTRHSPRQGRRRSMTWRDEIRGCDVWRGSVPA